ncbi:MAG: malate dehydrogenase (oxaloacetate-decarboxylating)(NADP+) [Planctomycetota bacterium]|jgi:malate dehydrogenase (oxaloacetate-decarboxylating)(NADP+)
MTNPSRYSLLHDPTRSKSTAFTREEREQFGLRGLLPHKVSALADQCERVMENLRRKHSDIERYILLLALLDRNETLFFRVVIENIEEIMPLIYTPTVGQACKEFAHIFRRPRGFYITPDDRGQIRSLLDNWPSEDVRVVVVTDGQRILGLGDLGANGMGIPIGKLSLYTACGGIPPGQCLPVMFDVGTNNEELLADPLYLGYPHKRLDGPPYLELMDEFIEALQDRYPGVLVQFEDFLTPNAYGLLGRYRDQVLCFNDDIQGTAAVALAGVLASSRITGTPFRDLRIMFLGAGSAATGIGDLMTAAFRSEGFDEREALNRLWFVDKDGLVVASRDDLMPHNLPYAHEHEPLGFLEAIEAIRPHVLIGATGVPGTFDERVVSAMAKLNPRPVIFALSNPTSQAECTAEQAYAWSDGRALFASGSPFDQVVHGGERFRPAQGNNAYVFPGIGLGAVVAEGKSLPDDAFLTAARALADCVSAEDLKEGALYPRLRSIRKISVAIATAVAKCMHESGHAGAVEAEGSTLKERVERAVYYPGYAE